MSTDLDDLDRVPVNVAAINVHSAACIFVNLGGRADHLANLVDKARTLIDLYDNLGKHVRAEHDRDSTPNWTDALRAAISADLDPHRLVHAATVTDCPLCTA